MSAGEGTMTLWGRVNSINVQKARWTLGELGLTYDRIDAGGAFGRLDSPEYRALNPNGRVPTLIDGDLVLWESNAVCRYLAARYDTGERLMPADPGARARADMWMDWSTTVLWAAMRPLFWQYVRTPEAERDHAAIARSLEETTAALALLDTWLETRGFVAGSAFTMGDMGPAVGVQRWFKLPVERPDLANLSRWYARVAERPVFRDVVDMPLS